MLTWFLLAFGAAIGNSLNQTISKWAVALGRYSKFTITFFAAGTASILLFIVSYFVGFPDIDGRFWLAVVITGLLNAATLPILLRAYEIGEFSSVYSMILLTPVFLFITSFIFLGEVPTFVGAAGVLLTVFGLWIIVRGNHNHVEVPNFSRGNLLGIAAAILWSVTVNFDKLATIYSDRFFAPAFALGVVAAGSAIYLLIKHKTVLVVKKDILANTTGKNYRRETHLAILSIFLLGAGFALTNVFHNSALLAGLASYTIAIKRLGVLFGVFWGWLFFKEKNISKKLLGAVVAVAGVVAILFS